jgi:2-polyprenyl-3-methyl-5-hydroxy-6-metoxy-1,4-benzoquinol methylase
MQRYSEEFDKALTEYIGDPSNFDVEAYTRVDWSDGLLQALTPYMDLDGKSFLDAGCGHGPLALAAYKRHMKVSAFDFVENAVDIANLRFRDAGMQVKATVHDIRAPVPEVHKQAYDLVINFQVLEHLPRSSQFLALRNLCNMVKLGGFLFIDTENAFYPHDRHDTGLPLVRLLAPVFQQKVVEMLGRGLNMNEPSFGGFTDLHDYLSYDEIVGAMKIMGLDVVDSAMPHGSSRQRFFSMTGSHWFYDNIGQYIETERFMPVSLLLQKNDNV